VAFVEIINNDTKKLQTANGGRRCGISTESISMGGGEDWP